MGATHDMQQQLPGSTPFLLQAAAIEYNTTLDAGANIAAFTKLRPSYITLAATCIAVACCQKARHRHQTQSDSLRCLPPVALVMSPLSAAVQLLSLVQV